MELAYSQKAGDKNKTAKGMGPGLNMSFKHSVVICDRVRNMMLNDAITLLESVVEMKKTIPFKRFRKGIGHRKGLGKYNIAKYPKKAASEILKVLRNAEANADYKGLDTEKMKLVHIQAQKGVARRRLKPKGRWHLWKSQLVHIQAITKET